VLIEAIVEDAAIKASVLRQLLHALPRDAIVATNTSSLSVSALGEAAGCPQRFLGMHFFNPAPLMALVEIIAGTQTDPAVVERAAAIAESWGKHVARAADVPGFIVNHVARPYYLEAFRILEDGYAGVDEIDRVMRALGGFRMGPLELTDLIGQDVNAATSRSVWQQLGRPPLLHPSAVQERLVRQGDLGRKTKRGAYDYGSEPPLPAIPIERHPLQMTPELRGAVNELARRGTRLGVAGGEPQAHEELAEYIFARIVVSIIAQAHLARDRGVATAADIDTALRYGTNYPRGPFEWTERIGRERCARVLEGLAASPQGERFRVSLG
jgi:3-hydroxybutyryl-CoA dehydrogenase